ncbi:MAG: sensor domain-containing phosphodiesterase [Solirubrobacterales bacterium]
MPFQDRRPRPKLSWSITREGCWRHISPEVSRALGFAPEELAGNLLFDYLHPEELDRVVTAHRGALDGHPQRITHRLRRRDGLYSWFDTTTRTVVDEIRGEVAEVACVSAPLDLLEPAPASPEVRMARLEQLREVLASEEITPFYQPIFELSTNRVIAYEGLSRFPGDPARTPDRWFAEAWELGLGVQLELLAVRMIARSLQRLPEDIGVCINASPPTMAASGFMSSLGAQAERVTVELTEHLEINDYGDLRTALAPLQEAGGKTAIDDFGAGYASLAHIVKLNPDWIKLDISLTCEIVDNPIAHSLARALASFGEGMGIGVIAEGIESEDEREALVDLGVRFGQGFHLGMPAPLSEALGAASA